MALARGGLVRQLLQNTVRRPAKQPKRNLGYIRRDTDSVKELAHEWYNPDFQEGVKSEKRGIVLITLPFLAGMLSLAYFTEEHGHRPLHMPYDYMYRRLKPFPFGDGNHSLFHDPWANALPEGLEEL